MQADSLEGTVSVYLEGCGGNCPLLTVLQHKGERRQVVENQLLEKPEGMSSLPVGPV